MWSIQEPCSVWGGILFVSRGGVIHANGHSRGPDPSSSRQPDASPAPELGGELPPPPPGGTLDVVAIVLT